MKKNRIVFIMLLGFIKLSAQQLPHYSNYMLNSYVMNPAVAGSNEYFEGMSNNRYQWVGITDAPRTYILSVNGPTKFANVGVGGTVYSDIVGPTRRTGFSLSYAYHLKLTSNIKLSMGLSAGLLQFMVDGSKITLSDPNDVALSNGLQSVLIPDFGAGVYAYPTSKKWYAGISIPQVMQNRIKFFDYATSKSNKLATHFYGIGGYKFDINEDFKIEPSICLKYAKPTPLQFDLGVRVFYKEKVWLGAAFRVKDAVSVMVGYNLKENITFAYAYDFTTSNIKKYSNGSHELVIGIRFHKNNKQ